MAFNVNPPNFRTLEELANNISCSSETTTAFVEVKFGQVTDVDAGETADVWSQDGTRAFPGSAELFNIASTSVNDVNTTGSGAWQVTIYGLDANYDLQSETVNLNGTSNVSTANTYTNIHRMVVTASATSNTVYNDGAITATGATSSNVMGHVPANGNQSQMSHYMIPAGYTGFIISGYASAYRGPGAAGGSAREAEVALAVKTFGDPPRKTLTIGLQSNAFHKEFKVPAKLPEKTLIWAIGSAASANTAIATEMTLVLINNNEL